MVRLVSAQGEIAIGVANKKWAKVRAFRFQGFQLVKRPLLKPPETPVGVTAPTGAAA